MQISNKAQWLLGDRGYDADWFRDALEAKGIQPCIPGRRSRNEPVRYDKRRYRRRSRIEIMFGRLKDWRRVATRYDRCFCTGIRCPFLDPGFHSRWTIQRLQLSAKLCD